MVITKFLNKDVNGLNISDNLLLTFSKYGIKVKYDENIGKVELSSKDVGNILKNFISNFTPDKLLSKDYRIFLENYKESISAIDNIKSFEAATQWHLAVGLGNESVLENSLCLHHIYGVPYIPGSAIKGSVRKYYIYNFLLNELDERADIIDNYIEVEIDKYFKDNDNPHKLMNLNEDTIKKIGKIEIDEINYYPKTETVNKIKSGWKGIEKARSIFGSQDYEGDIIFYDAYPVIISLKQDIMNVHYDKYYGEGHMAPGDWMTPNLISFLTVDKNSKFLFAAGLRKEDSHIKLDEIIKLIKESLTDFGVGAKTAKGYGFFETKGV